MRFPPPTPQTFQFPLLALTPPALLTLQICRKKYFGTRMSFCAAGERGQEAKIKQPRLQKGRGGINNTLAILSRRVLLERERCQDQTQVPPNCSATKNVLLTTVATSPPPCKWKRQHGGVVLVGWFSCSWGVQIMPEHGQDQGLRKEPLVDATDPEIEWERGVLGRLRRYCFSLGAGMLHWC